MQSEAEQANKAKRLVRIVLGSVLCVHQFFPSKVQRGGLVVNSAMPLVVPTLLPPFQH